MKTIFTFIFLLFFGHIIMAQITVMDSVPILITDTQSINQHYVVPYYNWNTPSDSIPVFYEKKYNSSDTASIWCRNIKSLSPEKLFLQSGNGIVFSDPTPDNNNILWCESNFQGQFDIYSFQYDNNFNITDTFRLTDDTIIETSIATTDNNDIYWIQTDDSLLIKQTFSINSGNINLLVKDTIDNKASSIYPYGNNQILYSRIENDSVHLYCCLHYPKDTLGNVSYVNAALSVSGQSFLWERSDTVFTYDLSSIILINYFNLHFPFLPAVLDVEVPVKFMGWPILAYTVKDSTFVFAISSNWSSSYIGGKNYYYFTDYNESGMTYCYYFPINYDIKEIQFFSIASYYGINYCILRVSKDSYERLYLLRVSSGVGINSEKLDNHFSIYPNPTKGNFLVELPENTESSQLTISNAKGQIIKVIPLDKGQNTYQFTEKLPQGVYFIGVDSKEGTVVKKLIVN